MVRVTCTLFATIALMVLAACAAPAANQITADQQAAISDATIEYLGSVSDVAIAQVDIEAIEGDFARARAIPAEVDTYDEAIVFLQNVAGNWQVLNYGTAFSPEDYAADNIPESLWLNP